MSELSILFFQRLAKRCRSDRTVVARLRRSLSFPPGEWPLAFPYVEPFLSERASESRRRAFYLAAGLWASAKERDGSMPFGRAVGEYMKKMQSDSIEKRFMALLDADAEQLPHRLRQMCALLKDFPFDFALLLDGLLFWDFPGKRTQLRWARDFYFSPVDATATSDIEENEG